MRKKIASMMVCLSVFFYSSMLWKSIDLIKLYFLLIL